MKKLKAKAEMLQRIQWNLDYHREQIEIFETQMEVLGELTDSEVLQLIEWEKLEKK